MLNDLQRTLCTAFPNCITYPFGSTITGLDMYFSDIDIYVYVPKPRNDSPLVLQAKKALHNANPKFFEDIFAIPNAKTPIVRCVHIRTKIKCDFNFKNMLGVCNSNLIRYYISLSAKVKPFLMVLKFWAKVHELMCYQTKFTNYSLIILALFYLQQKPYLFPPVASLQENSYYNNIQDGWNGGFTPIRTSYLLHFESATLIDLLKGFFDFYSNFDFTLYVVCPLMGNKLLKTDFLKPESLSSLFNRYKENLKTMAPLNVETPVCVQDPFELNHNVHN